jgi:dTDP-4-amino-4,6-dideoxy-D-galactose acyltransferase
MEQALCTLLEWDTEFFGQRIARLNTSYLTPENVEIIDNFCAKNQIDCLYFLATSDDSLTIRLAEENAYRLQDVRMVFELELGKIKIERSNLAPNFELKTATLADTDSLVPFVQNAFIHSRFYNDPHFSSEQCDRLYETWLIRSIEGNFADTVLMLTYKGQAAAFISCSLDESTVTGTISLVGVAEKMRGQKLGVQMVNNALLYFQQQRMQSVEVVTQARNIAAQRLYQKCGFRTKQTSLWYHKWFNN